MSPRRRPGPRGTIRAHRRPAAANLRGQRVIATIDSSGQLSTAENHICQIHIGPIDILQHGDWIGSAYGLSGGREYWVVKSGHTYPALLSDCRFIFHEGQKLELTAPNAQLFLKAWTSDFDDPQYFCLDKYMFRPDTSPQDLMSAAVHEVSNPSGTYLGLLHVYELPDGDGYVEDLMLGSNQTSFPFERSVRLRDRKLTVQSFPTEDAILLIPGKW